MLQNFNSEKSVILKINVLDYMTADMLSQSDEKGNLHSVVFFFSKMFSEKCNYKIYDKELLIIVKAFKEWYFKIYGTADSVTVLINYKNLKYFIIICKLNCCQVCWNEFFSEFNFNIIYWSEVINSVVDIFIHCVDDCSHNKKNLWNAHQYQIIFKG